MQKPSESNLLLVQQRELCIVNAKKHSKGRKQPLQPNVRYPNAIKIKSYKNQTSRERDTPTLPIEKRHQKTSGRQQHRNQRSLSFENVLTVIEDPAKTARIKVSDEDEPSLKFDLGEVVIGRSRSYFFVLGATEDSVVDRTHNYLRKNAKEGKWTRHPVYPKQQQSRKSFIDLHDDNIFGIDDDYLRSGSTFWVKIHPVATPKNYVLARLPVTNQRPIVKNCIEGYYKADKKFMGVWSGHASAFWVMPVEQQPKPQARAQVQAGVISMTEHWMDIRDESYLLGREADAKDAQKRQERAMERWEREQQLVEFFIAGQPWLSDKGPAFHTGGGAANVGKFLTHVRSLLNQKNLPEYQKDFNHLIGALRESRWRTKQNWKLKDKIKRKFYNSLKQTIQKSCPNKMEGEVVVVEMVGSLVKHTDLVDSDLDFGYATQLSGQEKYGYSFTDDDIKALKQEIVKRFPEKNWKVETQLQAIAIYQKSGKYRPQLHASIAPINGYFGPGSYPCNPIPTIVDHKYILKNKNVQNAVRAIKLLFKIKGASRSANLIKGYQIEAVVSNVAQENYMYCADDKSGFKLFVLSVVMLVFYAEFIRAKTCNPEIENELIFLDPTISAVNRILQANTRGTQRPNKFLLGIRNLVEFIDLLAKPSAGSNKYAWSRFFDVKQLKSENKFGQALANVNFYSKHPKKKSFKGKKSL